MESYPLNIHPGLTSLQQLVDVNASDRPGQAAFRYQRDGETVNVSYAQFRRDIEAFSTYLQKQGYCRAKIAVLGENSYEWILAYFAVVLSNNIIVPIDKELSDEDIAQLLVFSEVELLVHSVAYGDTAQTLARNGTVKAVLSMNALPAVLTGGDTARIQTEETELCAIIFTSGTTGKPKGVMLSQRALMTDAVGGCQNVLMEGPSMLTLPLHHTFGFTAGVLVMLVYHVPISISRSLRTFNADMKRFRPQNIMLVPLYVETMYKTIWKTAKEQGKERLLKRMIGISRFLRRIGIDVRRKLFKPLLDSFGGNLTLLVSGGAAIRQEYIDGLADIGILVLNGYGITECAPVVAVNRNRSFRPDSIGLALPCNEVKVLDGEICVRGENVMLGYYQDEISTGQVMIDGWFHTGDLGYIDEDGFIYITGRKKNLIILDNGENVSPEELEARLLEIPNVLEAVVSAWEGVITAEIYAEKQEGIQESVMALNKNLPAYKHIQRVKFRDCEFEKTTTKKIKRGK